MPEVVKGKSLVELGVPKLTRIDLRRDVTVPLAANSNSYDRNYRPDYNQEENRAENQSFWDAAGSGLLSRSLSIIPKVVGGFGSVLSIPKAIADQDLSPLWDNSITKWGQEADEKLRDVLPTYSSAQYNDSGWIGKMGTAKFWTTDLADGIAYVASAYVPGAVIGKVGGAVGTGARALTIGSKFGALDESLVAATKAFGQLEGAVPVSRLADAGLQAVDDAILKGFARPVAKTILGTRDLVKNTAEFLKSVAPTGQQIKLATSTGYNTVAEAAAEAYGTRKDVYEILIEKGVDEETAKFQAGQAAARVFKTNVGALIVPNFIENTFLHGAWSSSQKSLRSKIWAKGGAKAVEEAAVKAKLWSKAGTGILSEGFWEENIQTSMQQYEKNLAKGRLDDEDDYIDQIISNMGSNILGFAKSFVPGAELTADEIEGSVAIGLGATIGGLSGVYGAMLDKKQEKGMRTEELARRADLFGGSFSKAAHVAFRENANSINKISKAEPTKTIKLGDQDHEITNYELDEDGNTIVDPEAVTQVTTNQLREKRFWDAQTVAAFNNDPVMAEMNKHTAMASHVYTLMNKGYSKEEIGSYFDSLEEGANADLSALGIESDIKANIALGKSLATTFENISSTTSSKAKEMADGQFDLWVKKNLFYSATKRKALESARSKATTDGAKEVIDNMLKDLDGLDTELTSKRAELKKTFKELYLDVEAARNEAKALGKKANKTPEDIARLNELAYSLSQNAYANGPFDTTETRLARAPIGKKASLETAAANNLIRIEDIKTKLAAGAPATSLMGMYKGLPYSNDETRALKVTLDNKLAEESAKLSEVAANFEANVNELDALQDHINDEDPMMLSEIMEPEAIEAFGLRDMPWTSAAYNNSSLLIQGKIAEHTRALENIAARQSTINRFMDGEYDPQLDESATVLKDYKALDAEDQDAFVNELFYKEKILLPTKAYIAEFREELIEDETAYEAVHSNLLAAKAYFTAHEDTKKLAQINAFLDVLENKIFPALIKNVNQRSEKHREVNNALTAHLVRAIFTPKMSKLFESVIGAEKMAKIKEELNEGENDVLPFDGVLSIVSTFRNLSTAEQEHEFLDSLKEIKFSKDFEAFGLKPARVKELDTYSLTGPIAVIDNLIRDHYGDDVPPYITKFSNDYDFNYLAKVAKPVDDKFALKIKDYYEQALALGLITKLMGSNLDYVKFVALKEKLAQPPSLQQNIVLTQGMLFLTNPPLTVSHAGDNVLLSKGIGGSGKTFLLASSLYEMYKSLNPAAKVYAFSKTKLTSENINNAIFGDKTKGSFEAFMAADISPYDYIVIDEVYTFSKEELDAITAKIKSKRIIALGDPSQLKAEAESSLDKSLRAYNTIPLTTSYRTNVGYIASFMSKYQLNAKEVQSPIATASEELSSITDTSAVFGVIGAKDTEFQKLLSTPTTRSRVVLVSSQEDKAKYSGVTVLTVAEAQGYQWDEVFVDINELDLPAEPFEMNKVYYTAYSRTKSLLVTTSPSVVNGAPNTDMSSTITNSVEELTKTKDYFNSNINSAKNLQNILAGVTIISPSALTEVTATEEDVETNSSEDVAITSESFAAIDPADVVLPTPELQEGEAFLINPTNYAFSRGNVPTSGIGHIIPLSRNGVNFYQVVMKGNEGKYYRVAVLSEEEAKTIPLKGMPVLNEAALTEVIPDISLISAGEIEITRADALSISYIPGAFETAQPAYDNGATSLIEDVIIKFYTSYYGTHPSGLEFIQSLNPEERWVNKNADGTYTVNWKAIQRTVKDPSGNDVIVSDINLKIFDKHKNKPPKELAHVTPAPGFPYLIFSNLKRVGREGIVTASEKPFVIPLNSSPLDASSVSNLIEFTRAAEVLEQELGIPLGSEEFGDTVRSASEHYEVDIDTHTGENTYGIKKKSTAPPISSAMDQVVRGVFGGTRRMVTFETEDEAVEYLNENGTTIEGTDYFKVNGDVIVAITETKNKRFRLEASTDATNREENTIPYKQLQMREGMGPAQHEFNNLAKANSNVNGEQLRRNLMKWDPVQKKNVKQSGMYRAGSLLTNYETDEKTGDSFVKEFVDYDRLYANPDVIALLGEGVQFTDQDKLSDLRTALQRAYQDRGSDAATARGQAENVIFFFTSAETTLPFLQAIVNPILEEGANGNLNTPLKMSEISRTNLAKDHKTVSQQLSSSFIKVNPTTVTYKLTDAIVVGPEVEKGKTYGAKELFSEMKVVGELERIRLLVETALPEQAKVYESLKGIYLNGEYRKDLAMTALDENGVFSISVGLPVGKIESHLMLHEGLHAVTKASLMKGKKDRLSKKDTPEALLYQRIAALKKRFDGAVKGKINPDTGSKYKLTEVYETTPSELDIFEFVASLSNPKFRELAKSIEVLPKSKDSILKRLLQTILDYLADILGLDANVYDATLAVLENFYGDTKAQFLRPAPPVVVTRSVTEVKAETLGRLNKQLNDADEYEFDELAANVTSSFPMLERIPTYGETSNLKFRDSFLLLPEEEQLRILSSIGTSSFAYVNQNVEQVYTHLGTIYTSKSMGLYLDTLLAGKELTKEQINLIKSIIFLDASNPTTKLIPNILKAVTNDRDALYDILFTQVFNNKDKSEFLIKTNSTTNREAFTKMMTLPEFNKLFEALGYLVMPEIALAIQKVEDRSAARYIVAKNLVLNTVSANMAKTTEVMKIRNELFAELKTNLSNPAYVFPNGLTRSGSAKAIKALYAELGTANSNRKVEILYNELPALEDMLAGIDSLTSSNTKTNTLVLKDIIKDIYPNTNFDENAIGRVNLELAELGEEEFYSGDTELKESSGILEYLKLYNKSYETTLSESMKDFLSFVQVGNRYLSSALVYIKTMQLASTLDWTQSLSSTKNSISAQLLKLKSDSGLSGLDLAIIDNLYNNIILATNNSFVDGVTIPTNLHITAVNSIAGVNAYIAYEADGIKTLAELEKLPTSGKQMTSNSLFLFLKAKNNALTIAQFNKMLHKADAINVLRGVHNTMASMKETDLFISTRTSAEGNTFRMVKSRSSDVSVTIKEFISNELYERFGNGTLKSLHTLYYDHKFVSEGKPTTIRAALSSNPKAKKVAIRYFYKMLNLPANNLTIKDEEVAELAEKIKGLLSHTAKVTSDIVTSEDDTVKVFNFPEWLESVDGYISEINKPMARSDEFIRNPSVLDLNGNKFYKYHESSFMYDVLNNIIDIDSSLINSQSTKNSKFRVVPDHLLTDLHKHNIFIQSPKRAANRIYAVGEYAGAKNKDNGSSTEYLRENKFFFFQRKFITGFVDGIRQYGNSYHQFSFVPSDSPKHPLVRLGLLSMDKTKYGIAEMFDSLKAKANLLERGIIDIEKYEKSLSSNLFANFKVGLKVSTEFPNWREIPSDELAARAYDYLKKEALTYLENNIKELEPSFDKRMIATMLSLRNAEKEKNLFSGEFNELLDTIQYDFTKGEEIINFKSSDKGNINLILPLFTLFYLNNTVNSYHLNQLYLGDYSAFPSVDMIIKRFAGTKAPGIRGLVDPIIGMKETYKLAILADTVVGLETTRAKFAELFFGGVVPENEKEEFENFMTFFGDEFESTDAQGFMTPARLADLSKGFEKSWTLGNVHKPVYFGIDPHTFNDKDGNPVMSTSIARYVKNSTVVLTDELCAKFKYLARLREVMESQGNDEAVFRSAVKVGLPILYSEEGVPLKYPTMANIMKKVAGKDTDLSSLEGIGAVGMLSDFADAYDSAPVLPSLTLSNHNYRLQFNATTDVEKDVSVYSQLMYFLNVYGDKLKNPAYENTQVAARQVYDLIAELINDGKKEFFDTLTKEGLNKYLAKNLGGSGSERALDLIYNGVNHNHPILEKKGIIALASGLGKSTTKIKFKGGKLVLQTAEGVSWDTGTDIVATNKTNLDALTYKYEEVNGRKMLVAEVVVPAELLTTEQRVALKNGQSIYTMPDGMAFRIPSTELHSAIAFRIVDTYPGGKTNVIIAPKELVPIHGSDFDVDSLFVIMRETVSISEASYVDGIVLTGLISKLGQVFNELKSLEDTLESQEDILKLQELKRTFKEQFKLSVEVATATTDSGLELERKFQEAFIASKAPNEATFRKSWMKRNHIVMGPDKIMEPTVLSAFSEMITKIEDFSTLNPSFIPYLETVLKFITEIVSTEDVMINTNADTPVGYEVVNNKYSLSKEYLNYIKYNLAALESLEGSLQEELKAGFGGLISKSIKSLKSLKAKYLKNSVTETMLDVITDENNKYRMTTPIAFTALTDIIDDDFYKQFQQGKDLDLTNLEDEFQAFEMLTAGVVLTGAFANAAKSFGYLATAGAEETLNKIYISIGELQQELLMTSDADKKTALNKQIDNLQKAKDDYYKTFEFKEYRSPVLNYDTRYRFNINGEDTLFDRIATKDAEGKYLVTQVLDTLTNAAIDNLKLGYLYRAGINQNIGNAVVGLVSTGMPMEAIIALLYQDVFKPLTKSKVKNASTFVADLLKKYPVSTKVLSLEDLKNNITTPNDEITAAAVHLFAKGFKIGGDMRSLSTFLNIVKEQEVFVQNIFKNQELLEAKIGTYKDGVLKSRQDFSFIIPNMFNSAAHLKAAYEVNTDLISFIKDKWSLHSDPMIHMSKEVYKAVTLNSADETGEEYVKIRRAFSNYLLASDPLIKSRLSLVTPKAVTLSDGGSYVLSKQRTFNDEVATFIQKLQAYDRTHPLGERNEFLNTLSIQFNDQKVRTLSFRAGIGIQPEDIAKLALGFKQLNQYTIINGEVTRSLVLDSSKVSPIQRDLLVYALLNLGLDNSSSSYAAYIPSTMFKNVIDRYVTKLTNASEGVTGAQLNHFALFNVITNANRLPKIYYDRSASFIPYDPVTQAKAIDAGYEIITLPNTDTRIKVFFDKRFTPEKNDKGEAKAFPPYIKDTYKQKTTVFKLVLFTPDYGYYQKVGNINDVYYTETPDNYNIATNFTPTELTVHTVQESPTTALTYSKLINGVKKDDIIFITPSYNYDRSLRRKVQVGSVTKNPTGSGIIIKFQDISDTAVLSDWDEDGVPKSVDNVLRAFGLSLEEFSQYSPEEQQKLLDCNG
jgi:hypothetical protein